MVSRILNHQQYHCQISFEFPWWMFRPLFRFSCPADCDPLLGAQHLGSGWRCWRSQTIHIWMFPKIGIFAPQIIHLFRVFHYFHHPFCGTPIFGNTHIFYYLYLLKLYCKKKHHGIFGKIRRWCFSCMLSHLRRSKKCLEAPTADVKEEDREPGDFGDPKLGRRTPKKEL